MTVTMPKIEVTFQQLATSLIERSERGIAILIVKDDTSAMFNFKKYKDITELELDKTMYTQENLQYMKDIFSFGTYQLNVVKIGTGEKGNISDALLTIEKNIKTGWITIANGSQNDFDTLASWIKSKELKKQTYKAVTYKATTTDCKHIVNFTNSKVTFKDARKNVTGEKYTPSLIGILASCNVKKGCTYFKCTNLESVEGFADNDAELAKGNFILFNDTNYVRVAQGINSLITLDGKNNTEDMQYIETVEASDMINDDISNVFKNEYLGNYKNKYDNQVLFVGSIKSGYFKELAKNDVLDSEYDNDAFINVEAQRQAWLANGKSEAATWKEAQVKKNTFKRDLYLGGDIKILGSMTNLKFDISLF